MSSKDKINKGWYPSKADAKGAGWIYYEPFYSQNAPPYGKWLLFVSPDHVDEVWQNLIFACEYGKLTAQWMKVNNRWLAEYHIHRKLVPWKEYLKMHPELKSYNFEELIPIELEYGVTLCKREDELVVEIKTLRKRPKPNYVICVYTTKEDIRRVREQLRKLGFTTKIPYKTEAATNNGIYGNGAASFRV